MPAEDAVLGDLNLNWWFDEGAEPFPKAILGAPLSGLAAKGVDPSLLRRLTAAVVNDFSPDRKVWFIAFFDDDDPAPAIRAGSMGRFLVIFWVDAAGVALQNYQLMEAPQRRA